MPTLAPVLSSEPTGGPAVLVGAGDVASCTTDKDEATAKLLDGIDGTVFTLGDNAYTNGTAAEYADCYGPTWGRHKARTQPSPGDRDYLTTDATGYFDYFGAAAGDPAKGYYSYDLGEWHVVVLNSGRSMSATSAQVAWLKSDLAANSTVCTLAYWHRPRFYSNAVWSGGKPVWDVLHSRGVDVVLNADRRNYERFAPQNPDGIADPAFGIREFVVGTGGASSSSFGTPLATSEVRIASTAGVLKLTLGAGNYTWAFMPVAGKTASDEGTATCHGPPPPVARPGGPYRSEETVTFDGSASSDPQGDLPLTYEWEFGDGGTGTGVKPTHSYAADGEYTVTLIVTDSSGNRSDPATTTATIANLPPTVDAGPERWLTTGGSLSYKGSFTDYAKDSPWSYRIQWGDASADDTGTATAPGSITASHTYAAPGDYTVTLTVTDVDGGSGSDETVVHVRDAGPGVAFVGAGDVASCSYDTDEETAKLVDTVVAGDSGAVVFVVGDNAYNAGTAAEYNDCYHPTWGRHKSRTYAALGNHEYKVSPEPTWDYFGDRAGPRGKGYYSFDLGEYWHVIVLNDNWAYGGPGGSAGSAQDTWLQADLAANTKPCVIAVWHHPYVASGWATSTGRKNFWSRLYAAGAEIVLNGHAHHYERFAPQTPNLVRDDERGLREFAVGTGGTPTEGISPNRAANSEAVGRSNGVLKLTLGAGIYSWEFIPVAGQTFKDSGSGECH